MKKSTLTQFNELLHVPVGSARYALLTDSSDKDIFVLTPQTDMQMRDSANDTTYFVCSVMTLQLQWCHPLLLGDITGECTGNERLCAFLREHKREIAYAAPAHTVLFGLDYIAVGERYGHTSPIKAGLRTAMILSHMAAQAEDPFLLNQEEKSILIRARTGGVPPEERADVYRRTISPENVNRLLKMPDHPTIKNELFQLIEEAISC